MLKYLAFPTFFLLMEKVIPFAFFFSNLMLELNVKKNNLMLEKHQIWHYGQIHWKSPALFSH